MPSTCITCCNVDVYAMHLCGYRNIDKYAISCKKCSCVGRYAIHLYDMYHDGVWENRSVYVYYSELIFELSALSVDFCHHLHMLVSLLCNFSLTVI